MTRGLISLSNQVYNYTGGRIPKHIRPPRGGPIYESDPMTVRKVDENSTATSVTNNNTETVIASLTLPANTLTAIGAARLTAYGTIGKNSGGSETVVLRMKVADALSTSTVLATTSMNLGNSTSPHDWYWEAMFLGKQPSVNRIGGYLDISVAGPGATLKPSTYSSVGFSTMGLDEADQWTVTITAQMSAASTSLSVTRQVAILEGVN